MMVGAALLEMAGAAGACLAEAAAPALQTAVLGAAFVAPCLLPDARSGRQLVLEAAVDSRTAAVEVQSIMAGTGHTGRLTTHLTGSITAVPAARQAVVQTAVQRPALSIGAVLAAILSSKGLPASSAVSCASIAAPVADATAAYFQHPAAADASLHLSALTSQALTGNHTAARIPVAAGVCAAPGRVGSSGSSGGWATVKVGGSAGLWGLVVCS